MSQANLVIEDGTGEEVLNRISAALSSLGSCFYGATDPATNGYAIAGMWWADSGNKLIKQRNAANDAWVTKGTLLDDGTIKWGEVASADTAGNASALEGATIGTGVGNIVSLVDNGSGGAALPSVDGSKLTGVSTKIPLPDHIVSGGKITGTSGLTVTHGALEAYISKTSVTKAAGDTQTIEAKRLGLLTLDKPGTRGVQYAADPVTFIDNNTVGLWKPDGSATCPNLAYGVSSIAVANDLTKTGAVAPVDGIFGGNAAQGDGTSGSYGSANSIGFPVGAAEREANMLLTANVISSAAQQLWGYGTDTTNNCCSASLRSNGVFYGNFGGGQDPSTSYTTEAGKLYLATFKYDGALWSLLVNGVKVFSEARTLATTATVLKLLSFFSAGNYAPHTVHFFELRNKCRTDQQTAQMAAAMLFPVCWDAADGTRKNITVNLPADTISLGMVRTGASSILLYDDSTWQWGRREKVYGGNRVITQDYKSVVAASPDSMQWTPPFGAGATYRTEWRSAENTNGSNEYAVNFYYLEGSTTFRGVLAATKTNGKVGAYVAAGGSAFVNGAWRTGGYIRPVFTLQEVD